MRRKQGYVHIYSVIPIGLGKRAVSISSQDTSQGYAFIFFFFFLFWRGMEKSCTIKKSILMATFECLILSAVSKCV